ncbi:MAG: hypothetical protein JKY68_04610 [Rhodospirillales bacterium]|nr:hypothetical protein [Rhodospirillales bacterium]
MNLGLFNGFFTLMAFVGLVDCPLAAALNVNLESCILAHWLLGGNEAKRKIFPRQEGRKLQLR